MHKASLGDMEILSNGSLSVPKAVQTKFAPIIYPSTSNHCVGVQVSDTKLCLVFGRFIQAGNSITGGSNRGGGWA